MQSQIGMAGARGDNAAKPVEEASNPEQDLALETVLVALAASPEVATTTNAVY